MVGNWLALVRSLTVAALLVKTNARRDKNRDRQGTGQFTALRTLRYQRSFAGRYSLINSS